MNPHPAIVQVRVLDKAIIHGPGQTITTATLNLGILDSYMMAPAPPNVLIDINRPCPNSWLDPICPRININSIPSDIASPGNQTAPPVTGLGLLIGFSQIACPAAA